MVGMTAWGWARGLKTHKMPAVLGGDIVLAAKR
jgi:hypothetical protein